MTEEEAIRRAVREQTWTPVAGTDEEFIIVTVPSAKFSMLDVWRLQPPIPRLVYVTYVASTLVQ